MPGEIFLDLGCGRGNDVINAARMVGADGIAYGLDFTEKMLSAAEKNRAESEVTNAEIIKGELDSIPLDNDSINVVISNCAINHSECKLAVYNEINRIMKPGGRFIVSDILAEKELPLEVREDPQARAACYGGAITRDEYYKAIQMSGFSKPEVLEESKPYKKEGVSVFSITLRSYKTVY